MRAILTYHSIDESGSPISCHPDAFARHVAWLSSGRVQVVTLDDLMRLPASADAVAITFDDGYENFKEAAAPLLLTHSLPATLFVVAGLVGQRNAWDDGPGRSTPDLPLLDWSALVQLQNQGVTLGAHSMTHRSLPGLGAADLHTEVVECADRLEEETGRRPTVFAYPFGHSSANAIAAVNGTYQWACTTEFQMLDEEPVASVLPRLDMYYFDRPGSLEAWGSPRFEMRIALRHRLRQLRAAASAMIGRD